MQVRNAQADLSRHEAVLVTASLAQWLADEAGIRVLHIKGPAAEYVLGFARTWSDVDVLVDPAEYRRFLGVMRGAGFAKLPGALGSAWGHSQDLLPSAVWGARVDAHWKFPGIGLGPQQAFEVLWRDSQEVVLGGRPCRTPSVVPHALLLGLHAARSRSGSSKWDEADTAWEALSQEQRADLVNLADSLDARRMLGLRWGVFEDAVRPGDAEYWRAVAAGNRRGIWRTRALRAVRSPAEMGRLLRSGLILGAFVIRKRRESLRPARTRRRDAARPPTVGEMTAREERVE